MTLLAGYVQRSAAIILSLIHSGPALQQGLQQLDVAVGRRPHERRPPVAVGRLEPRATREQRARGRQVPPRRGLAQGRAAERARRVEQRGEWRRRRATLRDDARRTVMTLARRGARGKFSVRHGRVECPGASRVEAQEIVAEAALAELVAWLREGN